MLRFSTILSRCRFQVYSKLAGTEILLISETYHRMQSQEVFCKNVVLKNSTILTEKHLCQSFFLSWNFIKETLAQGFSCEFVKIFKNTFFIEHLCLTASILQQILTLYFTFMYSWQFPSSEKSLVGKKRSSLYFKDFTDLD